MTVTVSTDAFPAYEGYISINGGKFKTLYEYEPVIKEEDEVTQDDFKQLFGQYTREPYKTTFKYKMKRMSRSQVLIEQEAKVIRKKLEAGMQK